MEYKLKVGGVDKVGSSLDRIQSNIRKGVKKVIQDIVNVVEEQAVKNVSKVYVAGYYKKLHPRPVLTKEGRERYRAVSRPVASFENVPPSKYHPSVVTGVLRGSIGTSVKDEGDRVIGEVGSWNVEYAVYLELGWTAMSGLKYKYPWLYPAYEEKKSEIDAILRDIPLR